jgi:hypothetical protein
MMIIMIIMIIITIRIVGNNIHPLPESNHSRDHPLVLHPASEVKRRGTSLDNSNNNIEDCS